MYGTNPFVKYVTDQHTLCTPCMVITRVKGDITITSQVRKHTSLTFLGLLSGDLRRNYVHSVSPERCGTLSHIVHVYI